MNAANDSRTFVTVCDGCPCHAIERHCPTEWDTDPIPDEHVCGLGYTPEERGYLVVSEDCMLSRIVYDTGHAYPPPFDHEPGKTMLRSIRPTKRDVREVPGTKVRIPEGSLARRQWPRRPTTGVVDGVNRHGLVMVLFEGYKRACPYELDELEVVSR